MSQISVVQYNKLNVLQQNNNKQLIVLKKTPHLVTQNKQYNRGDVLISDTVKKKTNKNGKETKTSPAPVAVARRNARERNRVKQVNNGFANLRQHIPSFITSAFENSSGKGGNKKLSKVETLRMAVEYIRSLEDLLAMDTSEDNNHSFPSPRSSINSPNFQPQNNEYTYTYQILSPEDDEDGSSTITTSPQQFLKIDTSSGSFQVIGNTLYEDEENLDPMKVNNQLLSNATLLDSNLEFNVNTQDLPYFPNIHSESLSPEFYSEESLSPIPLERRDPNYFEADFNVAQGDKLDEAKIVVTQMPLITLKTENELADHENGGLVDVHWWEHQQTANKNS